MHLLVEGNHLARYRSSAPTRSCMTGSTASAFAVWAPNARRVSVVGDFNDWDGRRMPMRNGMPARRLGPLRPRAAPRAASTNTSCVGPDGALLPLKADPHAEQAELPPAPPRSWRRRRAMSGRTSAWMAERGPSATTARRRSRSTRCISARGAATATRAAAILTYRELADQLVPYVADLGFTHIEVMPVTEYPFDGSWGYQPIGAVRADLAVRHARRFPRLSSMPATAPASALWLDWVPGHFPTDAHGLGRFDGTALYEHADPRQGLHRDWNTLIYNYGRREVANFLLSNALYWLREFHLDGLRVDAVASMLYLDYSRKAGEWIPNVFGGRENLDAIAFLRRMNELVFGGAPRRHHGGRGIDRLADGVARRPISAGSASASNGTWAGCTTRCSYMSRDPIHRKYHHNDLTFGLLYAFSRELHPAASAMTRSCTARAR